jgi:predicted alpha/beta hydrolase
MLPEVIYSPTDDGWQLALHHWPARRSMRRHPVLMVHGLAANRLNLDLDERHSVAQAARDRGFDVYVLELRGAGLSRPPGGRDRARFQWGFGDHSARDLPAALRTVCELTGAEQVHGFGHSMGGMLYYALGVRRVAELRSITTVGTPLLADSNLAVREQKLLQLAVSLAPATSQRRVPLRQLLGAAGRFIRITARLADGLLLNVDNCDTQVLGVFAREGINDVPVKLMREMTEQIAGKADDGPFAYESRLDRVEVPVFAMGGSVDRIAPAASVRALVSRLRGPDVRYREMGKAFGDGADYGHGDLLVGRNAREEVFPQLLDYLEEVD